MDTKTYPHLIQRKGISTEVVIQWNGEPLTGCYLVKNTLSDNKTGEEGTSVILCPGGFDPNQGSFSQKAIRKLLAKPNISAVYEAHYCSEGKAGYLEPEPYKEDLKTIYTKSINNKPILVGMSASTIILLTSLYELGKENALINAQSTLLIGPFLPDHRSFLGKNLRRYYDRKSMRDKIIHHCGHKHVFENGVRLRKWWESKPELGQAIKNKTFKNLAKNLNSSLDALFFQIDTLSIGGKRVLKNIFGANIIKEKIPKHHRSLLYIPEFDDMLADYCENIAASSAVIKTQNKAREEQVSASL